MQLKMKLFIANDDSNIKLSGTSPHIDCVIHVMFTS